MPRVIRRAGRKILFYIADDFKATKIFVGLFDRKKTANDESLEQIEGAESNGKCFAEKSSVAL